eukprot:SAG11_NODE_8787_length_976_cov_1.189282_1_plen_46_part_01
MFFGTGTLGLLKLALSFVLDDYTIARRIRSCTHFRVDSDQYASASS